MTQGILHAINGNCIASGQSPVRQATTVYLCYPCITLAGIKTNRQLLKQLRLVAAELFEQQQAHLASVHALLPNKASWTKACLAMARHPEFLETETLICIRQIDHLGSPHLLLCQAFAEALLRRCPDGTKTIRTETHSHDDPSLPEEQQIVCKTQKIRICNGELVIEDL